MDWNDVVEVEELSETDFTHHADTVDASSF